MIREVKLFGLSLLLGALLSLCAFPQPAGLPTCVHQEGADGSLHWQCTSEELMGELATTLTPFAKHLTAVLRSPPKDIQLLLYNYKQESLELPLSKAYRFYKEQLMLPTEEDLMPWDWSYRGVGPIFFIDRQSPETIYFLEAPKKDPDCEVDWWLYWGYLKELTRYEPVQRVFAEDQPITQAIRACYYLPEGQPTWKYLVAVFNSGLVTHPERYGDMNPTAQSRIFLLSERNMDVINSEGNHWLIAFELENYTPAGGIDIWHKIFGQTGGWFIAPVDVSWEEQYETGKYLVATINPSSYTSGFSFEPYIKTNATLWRPQELGVDLGPEFDYLRPWPFIDIPVQVELIEPVNWEELKGEFQERYGAELERLRRELQDFGADPAVLDIDNWQFGADALEPGSYIVTVDGTIGLSDPAQPASEARFQGIGVTMAAGPS